MCVLPVFLVLSKDTCPGYVRCALLRAEKKNGEKMNDFFFFTIGKPKKIKKKKLVIATPVFIQIYSSILT